VKISPKKTNLFSDTVKWCGKVISKNTVKPDPDYIQGLVGINRPTNAAELQNFLSSANWIRRYIMDFARLSKPLQDLLKVHTNEVGSLKAKKLRKCILDWNSTHEATFNQLKDAIGKACGLSMPKDDHTVCLFTDASSTSWGIVITQIDNKNFAVENVSDQEHEPLAFFSGSFTGSSLNWSIIEKEAYPIIHALDKARHLLQRSEGFQLFTDHRNLKYIFDGDKNLNKNVSDRLARWQNRLTSFRYTINHITGENNVWADLLSRWGSEKLSITPMMKIVETSLDIEWPTEEEIRTQQGKITQDEVDRYSLVLCEDGLYRRKILNEPDTIFVPDGYLATRIMIIGHSGSGGHRGYNSFKKVVMERGSIGLI
jgi:hypothetical protein